MWEVHMILPTLRISPIKCYALACILQGSGDDHVNARSFVHLDIASKGFDINPCRQIPKFHGKGNVQ